MTAVEAKLDVIMNRLNNQERRNHSAHEVGIVEDAEKKMKQNLLMKVLTRWRKLSIFREIGAITSS